MNIGWGEEMERNVQKAFPVSRMITETKMSVSEKIISITENYDKRQAEIVTVFISADGEELSRQNYIVQGEQFERLIHEGKRSDMIWEIVDEIQQ